MLKLFLLLQIGNDVKISLSMGVSFKINSKFKLFDEIPWNIFCASVHLRNICACYYKRSKRLPKCKCDAKFETFFFLFVKERLPKIKIINNIHYQRQNFLLVCIKKNCTPRCDIEFPVHFLLRPLRSVFAHF